MAEQAMVIKISGDVNSAKAAVKEVSLSLKEQKAILTQLRYEYSKLSLEQRKTAFGEEMAADIRIALGEIQKLKATATDSLGAVGSGASEALSGLRSLAYILPGIGIAGIFNLAFEGLEKLFSGLDSAPNHFRNFLSAFEGAKSKFIEATSSVFLMREEIELAKKGFISKESVVKHYNETIGKTTGIVHSLKEAEAALTAGGNDYIEMTLKKAIAEVAASKAAEQLFKAAELRLKLQKALTDIPAPLAVLGGEGVVTDKFVKNILRARKEAEDFKKIMKDALQDAAQFGFNIFGDTKTNTGAAASKIKQKIREALGSIQIEITPILDSKADKSAIKKSIERLFNEINKDVSLAPSARSAVINTGIEGIREHLLELQKTAEFVGNKIADIFDSAFDALLEGRNVIESIGEALKRLVVDMIKAFARMAILKLISNAFAPGLGSLIKLPGFAAGGPVAANRPITVGESGRELFVPSTSGRIIPNNQLTSLQGTANPIIIFEGDLSVTGNELQLLLNRTNKYQYRNV